MSLSYRPLKFLNQIQFSENKTKNFWYVATQDNVLTYNNDGKQRDVKDRVLKIFCDTNRVCELEDSVVEWYENKYFQR